MFSCTFISVDSKETYIAARILWCDELDAIQENGVPGDQSKNASKMLALPVQDAILPKSYYTAAVIDCQGKKWENEGRSTSLVVLPPRWLI